MKRGYSLLGLTSNGVASPGKTSFGREVADSLVWHPRALLALEKSAVEVEEQP